MKLCLGCGRFWPEDAAICGRCGRSFGGRRCQSHHLSPASASFCTTCGSQRLTSAARSLNLHGVSRLLSILCLILAWKWLLHHEKDAGRAVWLAVDWALGTFLEVKPACIAAAVLCWCKVLAPLVLIILVLPGEIGRGVRRLAGRLLIRVVKIFLHGSYRITVQLFHLAGRGIRFLVR